jgi:hypothetical protein
MVLAIGLLVTFVGRSPRFPAAIVGGVGFGFFIDEPASSSRPTTTTSSSRPLP